MPLPVAKKSELVTVTKSATCAGANLYGKLRHFSGKSRDNCPVSKADLTLGRRKEAFLLPLDDSLWNNINGSSRDYVFDKRSCNSDSQSADWLPNTALSFPQWLKGLGKSADLFCWLSLQSYPSFSKAKGKNSFPQPRELQIPPGI